MASLTEREFREQIVQAAHLLFQAGVMSHSGHGNMSARLPGTEHILLTSGGHIAQLTAEQLAIVTFDGEVVDGTLEPVTREIVGMHSCVYRVRDDVPAVLLANHGLLAFGRDPLAAAMVIIAMEEAAEMTLRARTIGGEQPFPAGALERERRHMQQFGSML